LFVVTGFVACTLDTGGLGDEVPPVSEGDVAEKGGETACNWYYKCNCDQLAGNQYTSEEQCADTIAAALQAAVDEATDAELSYDAQCAGEALAALEELECTSQSELDVETAVELLETLDCKWFYGEDQSGGGCTALMLSAGDSCVQGARCVGGTCEDVDVAPRPDEDCDGNGDICAGGAVCIDVDEDGQDTCTVLPAEGETCMGQADLCGLGLTCDQLDKTCEIAPSGGEQCSSTPSACAEGFYCHESGSCAALPPIGEACVDGPQQCEAGARCDNGTCATEDPLTCAFGPAVFRFSP
jgi:hypothetical protein